MTGTTQIRRNSAEDQFVPIDPRGSTGVTIHLPRITVVPPVEKHQLGDMCAQRRRTLEEIERQHVAKTNCSPPFPREHLNGSKRNLFCNAFVRVSGVDAIQSEFWSWIRQVFLFAILLLVTFWVSRLHCDGFYFRSFSFCSFIVQMNSSTLFVFLLFVAHVCCMGVQIALW